MGWAGHGVPEIGGYPIPNGWFIDAWNRRKLKNWYPGLDTYITGRDHIVDIYGLGRCVVSHMLELFCIISQVGLMEMI